MSLIDFLKKKTPMVSLLSTTVKTEDTFRIATTAVTKKGFNTHGIMDYEWEIGKIQSSFFGTDLVSTATANFAAGFSSTSIISTIAINVSGLTEGEWITVPLKCTVNNEISGGFGVDDYTETATDESLITVAYVDANGLVVDKQTKKRMYITNGQIKPQRILNTTFASHYSDEYNDVKQSDYAEGIEQRLLGLAAYTANNKVLTNVPIAISQGENDGWQSIQTFGGIIYKGRRQDDGSITIVDRHGNNALGKVPIGDIQRLKKKLSTHAKNASSVDNFYPINIKFKPTTVQDQKEDQTHNQSAIFEHIDKTVSDFMVRENKNRLVESTQALMSGLVRNHAATKTYNGYTLGEFTVVNLNKPSGVVKAVNLNNLRGLADFEQLVDQLDVWAVTAPIKITQASNYKVTADTEINFNYKLAPAMRDLLTLEYDGVGLLSLHSLLFNQSTIKYQFEIQTADYKYEIHAEKKSLGSTGEKSWNKQIEADLIKGQSTLMKNEQDMQTIEVGLGLTFLERPLADYFLRSGWAKEYGIRSKDNINVQMNVPIEATVLDGKLHGTLHYGFDMTITFSW